MQTSRPLNILIVDDDRDTTTAFSRLLRTIGHEVASALTAAQAKEAVQSQHFDLMVCDIGLPECDGRQLLRDLLRCKPIKAIALSGYGTEQEIEQSLAAGFIAHLVKPVSFDVLI